MKPDAFGIDPRLTSPEHRTDPAGGHGYQIASCHLIEPDSLFALRLRTTGPENHPSSGGSARRAERYDDLVAKFGPLEGAGGVETGPFAIGQRL